MKNRPLHFRMLRPVLCVIMAMILLTACKEKATQKFILSDIAFTAEPPLYDGPNTLQAQFRFDPKTMNYEMKQEEIQRVVLTQATLTTSDSAGFDMVRNFVLQFATTDAAMEKAAVLNPVPKGVNSIQLIPSAEADLSEHFKQSEITLVLDADLEGDREEVLTYHGTLEFDITYNP